MPKEKINIVWLKRDLRLKDHISINEAENQNIPYLLVYLFEPQIIGLPDTSLRHLQFIYHSLMDMKAELEKKSCCINIFYADAIDFFDYVTEIFDVKNVFSYQETGTLFTWQRDKLVAEYLNIKKIQWTENQRDGIIRGISNRIDWDKKWYQAACQPILAYNVKNCRICLEHPFELESKFVAQLEKYPKSFQPAGETMAWKYLESFMDERGKSYHKYISKPLQSRASCSRLSPFLSWGNISVKQVYQYIKAHPNYRESKFAFDSMLARLKWHCHFIQKFEQDCSYQTHAINKGYDNLNYQNNERLLIAWKLGMTGIPIVDACMRCLIQTGWINFRMRAMLVSVLCHHLDIDWRKGADYLAQLFLDYEPGIHYPQIQMQAGTTGINTIRIYNPIKQSKDHDPEGVFIKKWVEELENLPSNFLHEPWQMTALEQQIFQIEVGKDYPYPLVDLTKNAQNSKEKLWSLRKTPMVQEEKLKILKAHVRGKKK
jgi:deoxyribodipyrimidine photo-lyase